MISNNDITFQNFFLSSFRPWLIIKWLADCQSNPISFYVVMSIEVPASCKCSNYPVVPSLKHVKTEFPVIPGPYKNVFASSWRICPRLYLFVRSSSFSVPKRVTWLVGSNVDGGGMNFPPEDGSLGRPRLIRAIQAFQTNLTKRIEEIKNGLPMKLLLFLVGFYCASAFATFIGQTGDWDVFSAGLAVIVVEGIGALMYKASIPLVKRMRSLISLFNYWKAGITLGLFLDAFKYELDNPFAFELDIFHLWL